MLLGRVAFRPTLRQQAGLLYAQRGVGVEAIRVRAEPRARRAWAWSDAIPALSKSTLLLVLVAIRIVKDVGIAGLLLSGVFLVHAIRERLSVPGWAAVWLVELHEWATIISYVIFAILMVYDMIDIHRGPPE